MNKDTREEAQLTFKPSTATLSLLFLTEKGVRGEMWPCIQIQSHPTPLAVSMLLVVNWRQHFHLWDVKNEGGMSQAGFKHGENIRCHRNKSVTLGTWTRPLHSPALFTQAAADFTLASGQHGLKRGSSHSHVYVQGIQVKFCLSIRKSRQPCRRL